MYTEIRELINFLARYFHLRIPRLRIGMFCEHMANNCLFRFQPYWNINIPKQHEEQRIIRISRAFCDETFTSAANSVGLMLEELLNCLPEHIILYVNPGEVFYCSCDYSPPIPIWLGSVNEDLSYNEQKVDGHSLIPPPPLPTRVPPLLPTGMDFTVLDWRVNLSLVSPRELGYEYTNPFTGFRMFRYVLPGAPNFTVETFAITRFGSFRKRPEHEKKFVDAIKNFVNSGNIKGGGGITTESNSATTTTSTSAAKNCGIWSSSNEGLLWMMAEELKQLNFEDREKFF